jgi:hypothetical protein
MSIGYHLTVHFNGYTDELARMMATEAKSSSGDMGKIDTVIGISPLFIL